MAMLATLFNKGKSIFIVLVIGFVLIVSGGIYWLLYPRPATLVSGLDPQKALLVTQLLDKEKIPYTLSDGGMTIAVDQAELDQARLKVYAADSSLANEVGLEIFSGNDLGMTDFTQHVNLVRGLQGELSRTISRLPGIADARVHISIPEMSGGARARNVRPQAAVTVNAKQPMSTEQVSAIQQLVAAAVPGMTASEVAVIDGQGVPVAGAGTQAADNPASRRNQDIYLENQVRKVLLPVIGPQGNLSVAVAVTYTQQQRKTSREELLPSGAWRGMPVGLLQNGKLRYPEVQPEEGPSTTTADADPAAEGSTELTFAHGRYVEQVDEAPSKIARISVSAIVGAAAHSLETQDYEKLIADALGLDSKRGDHVTVRVLASNSPVIASGDAGPTPANIAAPIAASVPKGAEAGDLQSWINRSGFVLGCLCLLALAWLLLRRPQRRARALAELRAHLRRSR
ncbi:flagellar M-ring protein FliF C-terminal domain-containing protein [Andreprevotia chitinilytica]|uniref:flagellar M-ring protein FliF C-terminal domain-containing protein n=1 Tax=Andreprevotia chitinilytica TaxID=396808 RepID=UPI00055133A0|nr:flagellar M-ring protein FliF C-terminal domain-containing protein [Andreprevotia chitinilytica]